MNQIITKDFHGSSIRLIIIDGKECFIAKDVASLLGYKRARDAITQHCKKSISIEELLKSGKTPPLDLQPILGNSWKQTKIILEADVWRLIIKSTMPEAEKIEKWIMEDVLPSIRKTGSYSISQKPQTQISELNETLDFIEIFEKFSQIRQGKTDIELLQIDSFLKNSGKKSILEILNLDLENSYFSVSELGQFSGKTGADINQLLLKSEFQFLDNGVWKVLENGKNFAFETKNQFSQIKWKFSVLNIFQMVLAKFQF